MINRHSSAPWGISMVGSRPQIYHKHSGEIIAKEVSGMANATLLAAAPRMLDALMVSRELLQEQAQDMRMKIIWDAIDEATKGSAF